MLKEDLTLQIMIYNAVHLKDELGRKIITKSVGLRVKTYIYLIDDGSEDKKAKRHKECVIKRKLKFENYKKQLNLRIKQLIKENKIYIEELKNL